MIRVRKETLKAIEKALEDVKVGIEITKLQISY
jgi:hypothetical protein